MRPQPAQPLLAGRLRFWAAMLLAWCTILAVLLGALFAHQSRVDGLE